MEVWQLFLQRSIRPIIYKLTLFEEQAAIRGQLVCYPDLAQKCLCMHYLHHVLLRWREVIALAKSKQRFQLLCPSFPSLRNHLLLNGVGNKTERPAPPSRRNN